MQSDNRPPVLALPPPIGHFSPYRHYLALLHTFSFYFSLFALLFPVPFHSPLSFIFPHSNLYIHPYHSLIWLLVFIYVCILRQVCQKVTTTPSRVSSKQSIFFFGSNRNKPKLNLFWLFFGLFCETKKKFFSVFFYFGLFWCFVTISKQTELS
jgi:hypothetical protein